MGRTSEMERDSRVQEVKEMLNDKIKTYAIIHAIKEKYGVSRQTVYDYIKRAKKQ